MSKRVPSTVAAAAVEAAAAKIKVQTVARRAGAAWNSHDRRALKDGVQVGLELGLAHVFAEYGGLRLRFDTQTKDGVVGVTFDAIDEDAPDGDAEMKDGVPDGGPASAPACASSKVNLEDASTTGADAGESDEMLRLREKAAASRARRQRQRKNRRQRQAKARLEASRPAAEQEHVYAPLWQASLPTFGAFLRVLGEINRRTASPSLAGRAKSELIVEVQGVSYSVLFLKGCMVESMTPRARGDALLELVRAGLSEMTLTGLLSRWAAPAASP